MAHRVVWAAAALMLVGAGGSPRIYKNDAMRVRSFEPPPGWELAPQASYPRLLASYAHKEGGRITLTAQHVDKSATAASLAELSRGALERQGFTSIRIRAEADRVSLEAQLDGGRRFSRQVYVIEAGIGYVLTLIAPSAKRVGMQRDFDEAARSLALGDSGAPDGSAP
jgi:hypothetical protein